MSLDYGFEIEPKGKTLPLVGQIHDRTVVEVGNSAHRQALLTSPPDADGVITREMALELHIFTADCLPILFFTETCIAAVHCGWRGAERGIVPATLAMMSVPPETLRVAFGPSILPCCFEVKEDFIAAFRAGGHVIDDFLERREQKMYFDLPSFVRKTQLGSLADSQVLRSTNVCTFCSPEKLPSYRRNGGTDPRIKAWIRRN